MDVSRHHGHQLFQELASVQKMCPYSFPPHSVELLAFLSTFSKGRWEMKILSSFWSLKLGHVDRVLFFIAAFHFQTFPFINFFSPSICATGVILIKELIANDFKIKCYVCIILISTDLRTIHI